MRNIISEIKRLRLADTKRIEDIEDKKNKLHIVKSQLDRLYKNPMKFQYKIEMFEKTLKAVCLAVGTLER